MKKVITYGTFDLFHKGHYNILKRAKALGDYLIVGVTSESYDIERGKLNVRDSLLTRIENVQRTGFADEIIIEEYQGQKLSDILKYGVDILVLGSDWRGKFDYLRDYCEVIYLERTKNISSTMLRIEGKTYRIGVIADTLWDGGIVWESKYVSGLHTLCVFSEDPQLAAKFCEKYELDNSFTDLALFLDNIDIVYVHSSWQGREAYVRRCLQAGKYVICDAPITRDPSLLQGLFDCARDQGVILFEKIPLVYLRAFNQLVWHVHGGLIGEVMAVKCAISQEYLPGARQFEDMTVYPLCAVLKLLGTQWKNLETCRVDGRDGESRFESISIQYEGAIARIDASKGLDNPNGFTIIGSEGRITVPDDWWNTGYFEARLHGADSLKRFCFNFEGNGLRYLLQEMMIMISDKRTDNARLFCGESVALAGMLSAACRDEAVHPNKPREQI